MAPTTSDALRLVQAAVESGKVPQIHVVRFSTEARAIACALDAESFSILVSMAKGGLVRLDNLGACANVAHAAISAAKGERPASATKASVIS